MSSAEWVIETPNEALSHEIASSQGVSVLTAQLLINRGIDTIDQLSKYMAPVYTDLHDPYLFRDMSKVIKRIQHAIDNEETICVYGDYDADGTTATSLLCEVLVYLKAKILFFIPDRYRHGYGLHADLVRQFATENKIKLLITVDCGITSVESVAVANEHGIDVIIADHHLPESVLPDAHAIINPKLEGETYPYKELAGVGLAFKIAQALLNDEERESELLDLVALGTIVDIAPLTGENRTLSQLGMKRINSRSRVGILALCESASIDENTTISSSQISFQIGPQINAAGRMGSAKPVVNLFLTNAYLTAQPIAELLYNYNVQRKELGLEIYDIIKKEIERTPVGTTVVASVEHANPQSLGVIGILASKIVEEYNKPTLLLYRDGDILKGSGRSVESFNLADAFTHCSELLLTHGGHALAAGLSLNIDKLSEFHEMFESYAYTQLGDSVHQPTINADLLLNFEQINYETMEQLKRLEPFGSHNPEPIFYTKDVSINKSSIKLMGKDKLHMKMEVDDGTLVQSLIMWNSADDYQKLTDKATHIDVLYTPQLNYWNRSLNIQLIAKDYKIITKKRLSTS